MAHSGGCIFSRIGSSPTVTVWDRHCFEYSEQKDQLMNDIMSNRGDCRTAPASTGLLIILLLYKRVLFGNLLSFNVAPVFM